MDLNTALSQLEAAAESSRLRLLAALLGGEAPVGDLVAVLGQSQPRVSRHLRLLADAGLVESFREGRSIFYRVADAALENGIGDYVAALLRGPDPTLVQDRERGLQLRRRRERDALRGVAQPGFRSRPAVDLPDGALSELLDSMLGAGFLSDVLDVGAGAGDVLRLLAPRARRVVGLESSRAMRQLARSRLQGGGLVRWTIRDGDARALPFDGGAFDLVVLEEVLGAGVSAADTAEDRGAAAGEAGAGSAPASILREAVRVLKPGGRLLVLDRILPVLRSVSSRPGRGEFFESQLLSLLQHAGLKVQRRQWLPGRVPDRAAFLAVLEDAVADRQDSQRTGTND